MWHAHVTVAAIIEHNQQFILVSDQTKNGIKLNQPAGHLEANETLIDAVIREVYEESGLEFIPEKLVGVYMMPANDETTYLRFCFKGSLANYNTIPTPLANDADVVAANWYSIEEIRSRRSEHRSMVVEKCFDDYLAGVEYPLDVIKSFMI